MERLTQTSDKGGVAFTFDLDVTCQPSEMKKILKIAEKLKEYEDLEEQGLLLRLPCKVGDALYRINKGAKEIDKSKPDFNYEVGWEPKEPQQQSFDGFVNMTDDMENPFTM